MAVDPVGVRSVIASSELAQQKGLAHRRRHAAAPPGPLPRDDEAGPATAQIGEHRRRPVLLEHGRPVGDQENARDDRDGVAVPQLALLHLALRRPHRRAARPQHRRRQLGDRGAAEEGHGHGRAAGPRRSRVRQHLRPLRRRVRIPERRPGHEHVPADQGVRRAGRGADRRHQGRRPSATARSRAPRPGSSRATRSTPTSRSTSTSSPRSAPASR